MKLLKRGAFAVILSIPLFGMAAIGHFSVSTALAAPCLGPSLVSETVNPGPPTTVTLVYNDVNGGGVTITGVTVNSINNATELNTPTGTTTVTVMFTKTNQAQGASFNVTVTNSCGRSTTTDPYFNELAGGQRSWGAAQIAGDEGHIVVSSKSAHSWYVVVRVNRSAFVVHGSGPGQQSLNVGAALQPGSNNAVIFLAMGSVDSPIAVMVSN
jgi:hypothetical protein